MQQLGCYLRFFSDYWEYNGPSPFLIQGKLLKKIELGNMFYERYNACVKKFANKQFDEMCVLTKFESWATVKHQA